MNGQGNYSIQVGNDPYARPPSFQQHPATAPPPSTSHYGPLDPQPQPQVIQHGHPSFHPRPGAVPYNGGMSSAQSYINHPRPPPITNQISHSYPTSEQQQFTWSQNVHPLPQRAPLQGQSAYQLPSSQGHPIERGQSHQHPTHTPLPGPPPLPPYTSSSTLLMSDPAGSSAIMMAEHSYRQPIAPVMPLPPPPPPPFPPSSGILSKKEGNQSWEGQPRDGNNMSLECPSPGEPGDYSSVHVQQTESGVFVGSVDADAAHSPTDSDMDMEDDITYPDEEKSNCLSANSNDECGSMPQEDHMGDKRPSGGHRLPEFSVLGNLLSVEASVAEAKGGGSGVVSDCGMTGNEQNGNSLDASMKESPSWHKNFGQSDCAQLPDQIMEGDNPLKILHGYSSNITCENEDENVEVAGFPPTNDVSTQSDAEKGGDSGSPRTVIEANKMAIPTGIVEELSDRSHRGQNPISSGTDIVHQSKYSLRNDDENIGLEEANGDNLDTKSDALKVDEFGRLVREDVSDSDTSNSPTHARRHGRRARKRSQSRSESRSRSPRDSRRRRRRRSPWRRKERRGRSPSLSPRRRSRSRSPVSRRDTEFGGDKLRREKGQPPGCFDFLRGKCYRGANCRYSHHESDKIERSRYNRGKQHYWDKDAKRLPVNSKSQSPDKRDNYVHEAPSGKHSYLIPESAPKYSDKIDQVDQTGKMTDDGLLSESSSLPQAFAGKPINHPAVESHTTKPPSDQEVTSRSLKLLPIIANHSPQISIPLPSSSQLVSASFTQPMLQDYRSNSPITQNHRTPHNYSSYEASVAYQHSHFPAPLKTSSSSLLPPPPPFPPPPPQQQKQHLQQSLRPPWSGLPSYTPTRHQPIEMPNRSQNGDYQAYSYTRESGQMLHRTDGFGSNSLSTNVPSREGVPSMTGENHLAGNLQGMYSSKSSQAQTVPLLGQSPFKGMHSSLGAGLSSESNPSHGHSYFQQASYGLQYSADVQKRYAEAVMVSSSASGITQNFLERNHPYVHGFIGSKISNYSNPYASTFDLPLSSKFSSNTSVQQIDATINTTFGTPAGSSSVPVDTERIERIGSASKNMISSSPVLPVEFVSRPGGNQYDPLFDSIERTSNSFSKADNLKHEITGDSDDVRRTHESGMLLNTEAVKQERVTTLSSNDSFEKEECGETADVVIGTDRNSTPSDPNDAIDMNEGEFEIDQLKTSGKKKKSNERSSKHFKISIAAFVKEVLKPSWRQGNMSKEAFKTIVKKTVDKVSGAMKSHQIPKSQAKINHYIDSSRGKLTKLVMGYVDKYVNV